MIFKLKDCYLTSFHPQETLRTEYTRQFGDGLYPQPKTVDVDIIIRVADGAKMITHRYTLASVAYESNVEEYLAQNSFEPFDVEL